MGYEWQSRTYGTAFGNVTHQLQMYTHQLLRLIQPPSLEELLSSYGGATCEEYSNIIQIGISSPPITGLQARRNYSARYGTLCTGESITFNATGGGVEFLFYLDDNPLGVKQDPVYLQPVHSLLVIGSK